MRIDKKEMLYLTEEEYQVLIKARELLDDIYIAAVEDGDIERASCNAIESICDLLQDENCEIM